MEVRPIHTEHEYELALKKIESLLNADPKSKKGDELEILSVLVEAYEEQHHKIDLPDPIEAIKFRMEQLGFENSDLGKVIRGNRGRVSEILNKKRKLTLAMIRNIHEKMEIPSSVLISKYE
jgi:HTH-type transcriptional regulator / antitoxin HigA